MNERLLTKKEIDQVLVESNNPRYLERKYINLGLTSTSVMRISAKHKLIMIGGNSDTGFKHIMERHSALSQAAYWKTDPKLHLDNPSVFQLGLVPIFDFLHIADSIFEPRNLITDKKNRHPELFDVYAGSHTFTNNLLCKYVLILYKGTKIIHTLFPIEKTFNRKKIVNLKKGFASGAMHGLTCVDFYSIPYYNEKNIELFRAILLLSRVTGLEKWYVQINTEMGAPLLTYFAFETYVTKYIEFPGRISYLDYVEDLSKIEKVSKVS